MLGKVVVFMIMFGLAFPLYAEPKLSRSEQFGDWRLQCFDVPISETDKQERCSLSQGVGTKKVKLIASVSVVLIGQKRSDAVLRLTTKKIA